MKTRPETIGITWQFKGPSHTLDCSGVRALLPELTGSIRYTADCSGVRALLPELTGSIRYRQYQILSSYNGGMIHILTNTSRSRGVRMIQVSNIRRRSLYWAHIQTGSSLVVSSSIRYMWKGRIIITYFAMLLELLLDPI